MFSFIKICGLILVLLHFVFCENGPPTQPPWLLPKNDAKTIEKSDEVKIDAKSLLEAAKIRTEIKQAVARGEYAVGPKDEAQIVAIVDRILGEEFRSNQLIHGLVGDYLKEVGQDDDAAGEDDRLDIIADHVDMNSSAKAGFLFIPDSQVSGDYDNEAREVLELNLIEEDFSFELGDEIKLWKSFQNGHLVGLADHQIIVASKKNGSYQVTKEVNFTEPLSLIETITLWNTTSESTSTLILTPLEDSLRWLDAENLTTFWDWKIGRKINSLQNFEVNSKQFLGILLDGHLMIYQIDIEQKAYWSIQAIPVSSDTREMLHLNLGYQMILVIPRNNSVEIFQSKNPSEGNLHFVRTTSIPTEGIVNIEAFQMGGYTYIAVGGNQYKIYRYHHGKFVPQTISEANFGYVDMFLPVPCRTYRDDMILIVQHKIDFGSHNLTTLEALIWNGVSFEASKSIPCRVGEHADSFGLGCMLDSHREAGLKGSVVVSNSRNVSLIVPRFQAAAGMFRFHTKLVSKETELERLDAIVQQMEKMAQEHESILNKTPEFNWTFDRLATRELMFDGEVTELEFNDAQLWQDDELNIDLSGLLREVEQLGQQVIQNEEEMVVKEAEIDQLFVNQLNGISIAKIMETFGVQILGSAMEQYRADSADSVTEDPFDILEIDGDLEFETINGVVWSEFLSQIVFVDVPNQFDYLNVSKIVVDTDMTVDSLNGLVFPDHFLLSNGPELSQITGSKTFTETLNANAIDCEGNINSVDPKRFITLSQDQTIPGLTTFHELEVAESFEINGTISGKSVENFVTNPTILNVRHIKAECQFKDLEVTGQVVIKGLLNNRTFDEFLDDVIYKTEQNVAITAPKSFEEVQFAGGVQLLSRQIAGIDLDQFITKSTDQELRLKEIQGNVFIENLNLEGLYNLINVTELDLNSIKINEDQVIDTSLTFRDPDKLQIAKLEITESLNGIPLGDYYTIGQPLILEEASMTDVTVDQLHLDTDIEGDGLFNGFDMKHFNRVRFSMSENQTITANVIANRIEIEHNVYVNATNGQPTENLLQLLRRPTNISALLQSEQIDINQLKITGNVEIKNINEIDTDRLWSDVVWLDRTNNITGSLDFLDAIHIQGDLQVISTMINGRNFDRLVNEQLIFKDNDRIQLDGNKRFTTPVNIMHNAEIHRFNAIAVDDLATKNQDFNVNGRLEIDGDIVIRSLIIEGEKLGDFNVRELLDIYTYDMHRDVHHVEGKVIFKGQTAIEMLNIDGNINGLEGPVELFKDVALKMNGGEIRGMKIFENSVVFEHGARFLDFNGLNLEEFFTSVVYVDEIHPVRIEGPVTFENPITAEHIHVENLVKAKEILGCSLDDWLHNTYRTDENVEIKEPVHFEAGILDGNSLLVVMLNDHYMADIITLSTPQNFSTNITLSTVYLQGSLRAAKTVNGFNLKEEYENTLRLFGDQHITAPTTIQSLRVARHFETMQPINGRDLREIAAIHSDQVFRTSISFKRIRTENLKTDGLISGINFTDWNDNILRADYGFEQAVTGNWTITEMSIEKASLTIKPPLLTENKTDLFPAIRRLQEKYEDLCSEVMKIRDHAANRVSFIKYLEKGFKLSQDVMVSSVHVINYPDAKFLVVNKGCNSTIYRWDGTQGAFQLFENFETGSVSYLENRPEHEFITHSDYFGHECRLHGIHSWKIDGNRTILMGPVNSTDEEQHYTRKMRSTEGDSDPWAFHVDLNSTLHSFTSRLVQSIQDVHSVFGASSNDTSLVGASQNPFGQAISDVAKRLWTGLQRLGDIRSVAHHATRLYSSISDTLPNITHRHEHDDDDLEDELHNRTKKINETSPEHLVGAQRFNDQQTPRIAHGDIHHSVDTIGALFNIVPLGFDDFVGSSADSTKPDHVGNPLENLVGLILQTVQRNPKTAGNLRRKAEFNNRTVGEAMKTLRRYAGDYFDEEQYPQPEKPAGPMAVIPSPNDVYHQGEAIALRIGSRRNRRNLLAVTSSSDYYSIRLYVNSLEGDVFQRITAVNPRSLVAIHIQEETLLAFIENTFTIRVMKYHGIEGFKEWSRQQSEEAITQLTSIALANDDDICRRYFLIAAVAEDVDFYEVKLGGMCPFNNLINDCNGWW